MDIEELECAFESQELEMSWYFDVETGRAVGVTDEEVRRARSGEPDVGEEADEEVRQLLAGVGVRYLCVPQDDPADAWQDMSAFIDDVEDLALQSRLREAIRGKGAFRRFRNLLHDRRELEDWYIFQQQRLRGRIVEWLASMGIAGYYEPD